MDMQSRLDLQKLRFLRARKRQRESVSSEIGALSYIDDATLLSILPAFGQMTRGLTFTADVDEEAISLIEVFQQFLRTLEDKSLVIGLPNLREFGATIISTKVLEKGILNLLHLADDDIHTVGSDLLNSAAISADRSSCGLYRDLDLRVAGSIWERQFTDVARSKKNFSYQIAHSKDLV